MAAIIFFSATLSLQSSGRINIYDRLQEQLALVWNYGFD